MICICNPLQFFDLFFKIKREVEPGVSNMPYRYSKAIANTLGPQITWICFKKDYIFRHSKSHFLTIYITYMKLKTTSHYCEESLYYLSSLCKIESYNLYWNLTIRGLTVIEIYQKGFFKLAIYNWHCTCSCCIL